MKFTISDIAYFILIPAAVSTSCIRDEIEDCPPLQINIAVKDKNYFNVDNVELEQRRSDDLAFREYVPTLLYVLRDLDTGAVVEESGLFDVDGDSKLLTIDLCPCIPHGRYVLTVWGGMSSHDAISDDGLSLTLNPNGLEGEDIYMANDTILYDAWHNNHTVEMERTKGKLIIEKRWERMPDGINGSRKEIKGIYANVNNAFTYAGTTDVMATHIWEPSQSVVTKTVLSPSLEENGTRLHLDFINEAAPSTPLLTPKDVKITMKRNELTVLRYVWDDDRQEFSIYALLNNSWTIISQMDIEEE
ncbi:MAG: hypothetical protein C7K11_09360 [Candidatus Amulumruptor caecigallinarius]|uniref:Uncharacterized protein n=1 Tax=Candidatus Amulumruptor caecigallinarius TaxID=2109911 RepID=A0A4Q0U6U3_9BACT|nr:MAG: hypothetical protein C7K11_09360 [Candidatus Amulumruptor caecigallinarius]HJE39864.1 hypothetical protein [Candidatus Amulumruptor caecigallinarius]